MTRRTRYSSTFVARDLGIDPRSALALMRRGEIASYCLNPGAMREHWRTTPEALKQFRERVARNALQRLRQSNKRWIDRAADREEMRRHVARGMVERAEALKRRALDSQTERLTSGILMIRQSRRSYTRRKNGGHNDDPRMS